MVLNTGRKTKFLTLSVPYIAKVVFLKSNKLNFVCRSFKISSNMVLSKQGVLH